jgi:sugar/nucleoside kinase (ribokinase family)
MTADPVVEICVAGLVYFEVFVPGSRVPAPGEETFVEGIHLGMGGALNTASVAAALGVKVLLAHPRGEGLSDVALADGIARLGIPSVTWASQKDPAVSLVFAGPEDRAFVSASDFGSLSRCGRLPAAKWIHVPGLLEAHYMAGALAQARAAGALISVSGSWAPGELTALRAHSSQPWDLLVLNAKEAALAAGDPRQAPALLQGAARSVVVTDGAEGAFGWLDGVPVSCPGEQVVVRDFTGAGDAFCAGLLTSLLRGAGGDAALANGCRVASRILAQAGGVVEDRALLADLGARA